MRQNNDAIDTHTNTTSIATCCASQINLFVCVFVYVFVYVKTPTKNNMRGNLAVRIHVCTRICAFYARINLEIGKMH